MKTRNLLNISSAFLLVVFALSSCNSSIQIAKKRHSNGYYVNVAGGTYESKARPVEKNAIATDSKQEKANNNVVDENEKSTTKISTDLKSEKSTNTSLLTKKESNSVATHLKSTNKKVNKVKQLKKAIALKKTLKENKSASDVDTNLLLLLILAILLPPLAVFLVKGLATEFWISLLLTLLLWIPGLIYALLIVLGVI